MKKLLLLLFILISGTTYSQMYQCDSIAEYKDVYKSEMSLRAEVVDIVLGKDTRAGKVILLLTFGDTVQKKFYFTDTLLTSYYLDGSSITSYKIVSAKDSDDERTCTVGYREGKVESVGILTGKKLVIYHVKYAKENG